MESIGAALFYIALAVFVVWLAVTYWQIILLIVGLGAIVFFIIREQKKARERQREREQKETERQQKEKEYEESQTRLRGSLVKYISDSRHYVTKIAVDVAGAKQALDQAQQDFDDGLFAPFWDSIESAANQLIQVNDGIQKIKTNTTLYKSNVAQLKTNPPSFELGLEKFPDLTSTAERMRAIVRQAQRDFHFATIYEQRKTNRILGDGFSNLGEALREMGNQLDYSLMGLADSLSTLIEVNQSSTRQLVAGIESMRQQVETASQSSTRQLVAGIESTRQQVETASQHARDDMASDAKARRTHEKKELEMLDNIQRHKEPS